MANHFYLFVDIQGKINEQIMTTISPVFFCIIIENFHKKENHWINSWKKFPCFYFFLVKMLFVWVNWQKFGQYHNHHHHQQTFKIRNCWFFWYFTFYEMFYCCCCFCYTTLFEIPWGYRYIFYDAIYIAHFIYSSCLILLFCLFIW